ncbi:hypothetical protein [Streptomyces griseocarneus]|nr:hypothetical protein [Streptomyces griseocarneus]GHG80493.1 hypothetical protein GCM10018779_62100 [Streptomyces griseocarneus]
MSPRRLLTAPKGNHCRAPLAATVLAKRGSTSVETQSAGFRD